MGTSFVSVILRRGLAEVARGASPEPSSAVHHARSALFVATLLLVVMRAALACHAPPSLAVSVTHGQLHRLEEAVDEAVFDNCFLATTPVVAGVETSSGEIRRVVKPIEDVQQDEWVQAKDPRTGEVGWKRVKELHRNWTDEVWYVRVGSPDCLPPAQQTGRTERHEVGSGGGEEAGGEDGEPPPGCYVVRCTAGHPWAVRGADGVLRFSYTAALRAGDRLDPEPGAPEQVVLGIEVRQEVARTYNFEVEGWHTYYVSGAQGQPGVLVHNTSRAASFVYRLVNRKSGAVYYGIAEGRTNLIKRFLSHQVDPHKLGRWDTMEVIGRKLTHSQARNLEAALIKQRILARGATGSTFAELLANADLLNKNRGRLWERVMRAGGPKPDLLAPAGVRHAVLDPLSHLSPSRQLSRFGF